MRNSVRTLLAVSVDTGCPGIASLRRQVRHSLLKFWSDTMAERHFRRYRLRSLAYSTPSGSMFSK